jgi:hypothetical protein
MKPFLEQGVGPKADDLYQLLLLDLGIDHASDQWPGMTLKDAYKHSLAKSFIKKLVTHKAEDADEVAYRKFLAANESCRKFSFMPVHSGDEELIGGIKKAADEFFHPSGRMLWESYSEILNLGKGGPGASLATRGKDFYTKYYSSCLSTTSPELYLMYNAWARLFPEWSNAELIRRENSGEYVLCSGSRLSFVPKTNDVSRSICTEPSLNMFFQLGLGKIIEARLQRSYGIRLSTQPDYNRELARIGSIDESFVTIDLSSASDTISLNLCRDILPSWVYETLAELRSPCTTYRGVSTELSMVSTMGNGFTFPLQTAIFSFLVDSVYRSHGIPLEKSTRERVGNFAVFGDDIIVLRSCAERMIRLLRMCGFQPNMEKTFVEGPFRESCGHDYFRGHNIRGFYLKDLDSMESRYVAINSLVDWSARSGIMLYRTVEALLESVRWQPVPRHENPECGIRVPSSLANVRRGQHGSYLYKRQQPLSQRIRIGDGWISSQRGVRRYYNPSGLLLAFLRGDVTSGTITVRHDSGRFRTKQACTPSWDYALTTTSPLRQGPWLRDRHWESAAYYLIGSRTPRV